MKKLLFILMTLFSLVHINALANSYMIEHTIYSKLMKEAIISCLSIAPKNNDNQPNRQIVKRCLEKKGVLTRKKSTESRIVPLVKENKKNK